MLEISHSLTDFIRMICLRYHNSDIIHTYNWIVCLRLRYNAYVRHNYQFSSLSQSMLMLMLLLLLPLLFVCLLNSLFFHRHFAHVWSPFALCVYVQFFSVVFISVICTSALMRALVCIRHRLALKQNINSRKYYADVFLFSLLIIGFEVTFKIQGKRKLVI